MQASAGQIVCHKDDPVDSKLIVLQGRFRAIQKKKKKNLILQMNLVEAMTLENWRS